MTTDYPLDPLPGVLQRPDLKNFDAASNLEIKKVFDPDIATFLGSTYQATWRGSIPGNSSIFFFQSISPGDLLRGFSYRRSVSGGFLEYRLRVGCTPGLTLETINGYNLDRRRFVSGVDWLSLNPVLRVDGLTVPGIIVDQWFDLAPNIGWSAETFEGVNNVTSIDLYDETVSRCFEIENTDNGASEFALSLSWKEVIPF